MTTQDSKQREIKESKQPASSSARESLILHGFTCPITQELMQYPVVTADGISYEETAIKMWFTQGKRTSPSTGLPLSHLVLTPNVNLRQAIEDFLKQEPEFAKVKELERASKTQEQIMQDLQLAIKLREEELQAQRAKQRQQPDEKSLSAGLLSRQGLLSEDPRQVEQRLGKAVFALVDALDRYLPALHEQHFDSNASGGFASALINALRKQKNDSQALSGLLESPTEYGIPMPVASFLSSYLARNPVLHELTTHPTLAKALEVQCSPDSLLALREQYGQESPIATATASSHASSASSSISSSSSSSSSAGPDVTSTSLNLR